MEQEELLEQEQLRCREVLKRQNEELSQLKNKLKD
jgi:hypothetical protein